MQAIADCAKKFGIPAIFWHTLGKEMLPYFMEGMRAFDFVGCADEESISRLKARGIEARLFPHAFSPEQFNPLTNLKISSFPPILLFDGITRMIRFPYVCEMLEYFLDFDLQIIDTGMLTSPYNLNRFPHPRLLKCSKGNVSTRQKILNVCISGLPLTWTRWLAGYRHLFSTSTYIKKVVCIIFCKKKNHGIMGV